MEKHEAISHDYMTVGEVAKKMGVTVRTLQYYDKEGIFSPSAESEGGRRLYTKRDIVKLHQIQSMKYLGFSLKDIKHRLPTLNSPSEVATLLSEQTKAIREEIKSLKEVLATAEKLKNEVLQMDSVDWKMYANIVINLQMGNNFYGAIKHMDNDIIEDLSNRFTLDEAQKTIDTINHYMNTAVKYLKDGIAPESEQGQALAKKFWDIALETAGGDIEKLMKIGNSAESSEGSSDQHRYALEFIGPALGAYFTQNNYNPFEVMSNKQ